MVTKQFERTKQYWVHAAQCLHQFLDQLMMMERILSLPLMEWNIQIWRMSLTLFILEKFLSVVCVSHSNIKKEIFEFNAFLEFASNVDPRLSDGEMLFYLHPSRNIYSLSLTEKFITFYQNTLENMLEERFLNLIIYPSILQFNFNTFVTIWI